MNFVHKEWVFSVLIFSVLFIFLMIKYDKSYFKWIKKYWFFDYSSLNYIRWIASSLGFLLLILSLLDLRGPAQQVQSDILDQKTIIIIDASSSMLAEDVRPNRFKKALVLARHFVKKSVGHKIAVVIFSDIQKRLVPFTDDIDLLDSRIEGLEELNLNGGGSNIKLALLESVQYFKSSEKSGSKEKYGNILLFTDGEESGVTLDLKIPDYITVGVVGVGTITGALIPYRGKNGVFRGYKKYNGKEVKSKLDKGFFKKYG